MSILARRRRHPKPGTGTGFCREQQVLLHCAMMCHSLIAELACDKQISALQNTQTRRDGYSIKVLDLERFDFLALVLDPTLEQVSVLVLKQEKEGPLVYQREH